MADPQYQIKKQDDKIELSIAPTERSLRDKTASERPKNQSIQIDLKGLKLPESEGRSRASALIAKPPVLIPGIEKIVNEVEPDNPEMRIFAIRNIHGSDHFYINVHEVASAISGSPVLEPEVKEVVKSLVRKQVQLVSENLDATLAATSYFSKSSGVSNFYLEGKSVQSFRESTPVELFDTSTDGTPEQAEQIWERIKQMDLSTQENLDEYIELRKKALLIENAQFRLDGNIFDKLPSGVTALPTESEALIELIDTGQRNDLVQNCREDLVLELVNHFEASGDKVAVLVFGGAHEFADNVRKYNEQNGRRIALTTLEPVGYGQSSEALMKDVEALFEKLNVKLPPDYREILKKKLGG